MSLFWGYFGLSGSFIQCASILYVCQTVLSKSSKWGLEMGRISQMPKSYLQLRRFVINISHLLTENWLSVFLRGFECGHWNAHNQQKPLLWVRSCDLMWGIKALVWAAPYLVVIQVGPTALKFRSSPWRNTPTTLSVRNLSFSISVFHFRKPDVFYTCSLALLIKQF